MDDETREALEGSIRKWEAIVAGTGEDNGRSNCPLCQKFVLLHVTDETQCQGCPVKEHTGVSGCTFSPYEEWEELGINHINQADDREEAVAAAQAELDFLKSLRPKDVG